MLVLRMPFSLVVLQKHRGLLGSTCAFDLGARRQQLTLWILPKWQACPRRLPIPSYRHRRKDHVHKGAHGDNKTNECSCSFDVLGAISQSGSIVRNLRIGTPHQSVETLVDAWSGYLALHPNDELGEPTTEQNNGRYESVDRREGCDGGQTDVQGRPEDGEEGHGAGVEDELPVNASCIGFGRTDLLAGG